MNGLTAWSFGDTLVRTVTGDDGEPWFVGKDVAAALGYSNVRDAIAKHVDEDDKRGSQIATPGGKQEAVIINEGGMYSLIFGSKLDEARRFKKWVTGEVLPQIRKTGGYTSAPALRERQLDIELMARMKETLDTLHKMFLDGSLTKKTAPLVAAAVGLPADAVAAIAADRDERDPRIRSFVWQCVKVGDYPPLHPARVYEKYCLYCSYHHERAQSAKKFYRRFRELCMDARTDTPFRFEEQAEHVVYTNVAIELPKEVGMMRKRVLAIGDKEEK